MARRVKDFIEISDYTSLDQLINTLTAIRGSLPEDADPELKLKGDDIFGRRISITYFRDLTAEEADCEVRYGGSISAGDDPDIEALRRELEKIPYKEAKRRRAA